MPSWCESLNNHRTGNCKLAVTPIRLNNETITSDYAYWHDIWVDAHLTLLACVDRPENAGGYHHTGVKAHSRLSKYDIEMGTYPS